MSKRATLLLVVILTVSSLITAKSEPALAAISKPSVPEFTMRFVDHSYDVSTTYSVDPYTGENVTHPSYHVKLIALEMTIKNQPFAPYYDAGSGWNISFYYNIRIKGYYSEDWIELYRPSDGYPTQSDSEYTVISLGTLGENGLSLVTNAKMIDVPSGGRVDFQVEAMIGYVSRVYNPNATGPFDMYPWRFTGEASGWSETQTLTIPTSTPSPSPPSPTSTPNQTTDPTPEETPTPQTLQLEATIGIVIAVAVLGAGLLLLYRKQRREARQA
jgi:hypothetical protein